MSGAAAVAQRRWVLAAAVLGSTIAFVDESVVNVALPRIEADLGASLAAMQWVVNAYTLCMSALLLVGGAAADQFGRRRLFVLGLSLFALASLGCGLAPDAVVLVGARAAQGAGAALLVPCSLALIGAAFDEQERGAAIGVWSGASAIAAGAAPLLGGALIDHTSWRVIFLINPVLAIPTLWIALRRVPESRDPDAAPSLDWRGAALAFAGLGALVYALIESSTRGWADPLIAGTFAGGAALLVGFVFAERRAAAPMMPLELFRSPVFSGINALTLLLYGALGGAFFFLPFLLIQARGYPATAAGAAYLPFTLLLGVLSRWSGGLIDRFGARGPLIIGPTVTALGFALLALSGGSYLRVLGCMIVLGLGMAVTVAPLTTAVINAVPQHRTGVASGINNAVAAVGGLLVIAVLGSLALGDFDRGLDARLAQAHASGALAQAVADARGGFVVPSPPASLAAGERVQLHQLVTAALTRTLERALWVAALLTLLSALVTVVWIPSPARARPPPASG